MPTHKVPDPTPEEDYDDILEWTEEEEEAFLEIVEKQKDENGDY
jgi:hypothetical protein